jgi:hypothetical protein
MTKEANEFIYTNFELWRFLMLWVLAVAVKGAWWWLGLVVWIDRRTQSKNPVERLEPVLTKFESTIDA